MAEIKLPSNSDKSRMHEKNKHHTLKNESKSHIKGSMIMEEESTFKKISKIFLPEDIETVKKTIIYDYVIPNFRKTALGIVNFMLGGDVLPGEFADTRRNYSREKRAYEKCYSDSTINHNRIYEDSVEDYKRLQTDDIRVIEDARRMIIEELSDGKTLTVAQLYEIMNYPISDNYMLEEWGWRDIDPIDVRIMQNHNKKYSLMLPKPVYLRR